MFGTMSHDISLENQLLEEPLRELWMRFQGYATKTYKRWYDHWISVAESEARPVYFFRFEDVLDNPKRELTGIFKFILGMESLEGTVIERRIEEITSLGMKAG